MKACVLSCAGIICAGAVLLASSSAPAQNLYFAAAGSPGPIQLGSESIYQVTPGGSTSIFAGNLGNAIRGMTFNQSGDLFALTEGGLGSVIQFTPSGAKSTYASELSGPFDLAFNSSGDLFVTVASGTSPGIVEIAPGGETRTTFATGLNEPRGLAFNSAGNLFVANLGSSNILEIAPDGTKTVFATGLVDPFGLAFNSAGDLFVSDPASGDITKITPDGAKSTFATDLENPRFLAFDSAGDLFVSNLGASNAGIFDNGYLTEITPDGTETDFDKGFTDVSGLAIWPVPEPSPADLIAVASVGLFIRRRAMRK